MISTSPQISVVMPVYNGMPYLKESIESILNQSFRDFEFIIVNDGSSDNTVKCIRSYSDSRIKLVDFEVNKGDFIARNAGIDEAKGKYICVMDSDDISLSHRLQTQFNFMENNPDIGASGAFAKFLGTDKFWTKPTSYDELRIAFLKDNCTIHPTMIIKRQILNKFNFRYLPEFGYADDYDIVARLLAVTKVINIPKTLINYRLHEAQITQKYRLEQSNFADKIRINQIHNFGIRPTHFEEQIHLSLVKGQIIETNFTHREYLAWANKLVFYNTKREFYKNDLLLNFLRKCLKQIQHLIKVISAKSTY